MKLDKQQSAVEDWTLNGQGSLNLSARAGCGKTHTLIEGVVTPIAKNDLGTVALMAYNKKAAEEFEQRIQKKEETSGHIFSEVSTGTVHSFGMRIIMQNCRGKRRPRVFGGKTVVICKRLAGEDPNPDSPEESPFFTERFVIKKLVSHAKQKAIGYKYEIGDFPIWQELVDRFNINGISDPQNITMEDVIRMSMIVLEESFAMDNDTIDFDDMILSPLVHDMKIFKKDWVLIDEAQDTNDARRELALAMLSPEGRLVAVGDDKQAIYGFTGADSDSMHKIAERMDSISLPLTVTYRCPKAVVREANKIVPDLVAHESAPEGSVSRLLEQSLDSAKGNPWFKEASIGKGDAVLCRNTGPLVSLAYSFLANSIPCKIEGSDIGKGLIEVLSRWKDVELVADLMPVFREYISEEMSKASSRDKTHRMDQLDDIQGAIEAVAKGVIEEGGNSVREMVQWIKKYFSDTDGQISTVLLSTIHKSKGREWDRVFLYQRSKRMPSPYAKQDWQKEQESNLEYVAITRSKNALVFVD